LSCCREETHHLSYFPPKLGIRDPGRSKTLQISRRAVHFISNNPLSPRLRQPNRGLVPLALHPKVKYFTKQPQSVWLTEIAKPPDFYINSSLHHLFTLPINNYPFFSSLELSSYFFSSLSRSLPLDLNAR
jgi:hypothetical protein